jgi:hypothetical protein
MAFAKNTSGRIMQKRRRNDWRLGGALCLTIAVGCGSPPPPPAAPAPPPEAPAPAAPQPVPETTAAPEQPPEPSTPELGPSPLHVAGEHDAPFALFGLGDVGFVHLDGRVLEVRDDKVAYDRAPNRGLPSGDAYEDVALAGVWPDTAFVVATRTDRNRRRSELFFWDGNRWKSKLQTRKSTVIRSLAPWNLRRVLALLQNVDDGTPSFRVIAGFPLDPVPHPASSDFEGCKTKVKLEKAAILRSGHVFAAGPMCESKGKTLAVERWEPKTRKGTVEELPGSEGATLAGIVAKDATHVVMAGGSPNPGTAAYVATFDGSTWTQQQTPMQSGVSAITAGADGAVWAVTVSGNLWKRSPDKSWSQVPMPPVPNGQDRIQAVSVWAKAPGDTWVVGRYASQGKARTVLMHTRPHDGPVLFTSN